MSEDDSKSNEWVPDDALAALTTERQVNPQESHEELSRRLFRENASHAVLGIIHTARHGSTERTRLDAQKYIVERVLGKPGDDLNEGAKNPIESFLERVEAAANKGA